MTKKIFITKLPASVNCECKKTRKLIKQTPVNYYRAAVYDETGYKPFGNFCEKCVTDFLYRCRDKFTSNITFVARCGSAGCKPIIAILNSNVPL